MLFAKASTMEKDKQQLSIDDLLCPISGYLSGLCSILINSISENTS